MNDFLLSGSKVIVASLVTIGMPMLTPVGSGGSPYVLSSTTNTATSTVTQSHTESDHQLSQQLHFIKKIFHLNDESLANILNVERKTIHNWKHQQSMPRGKSRQRLFDLFLLAKNWQEQGFPSDELSLSTPLLGSKSILDTLPSLNQEQLLFLGRYLLRQQSSINLI